MFLCIVWSTIGYGIYTQLPSTSMAERKKAEDFFAKGQQWIDQKKYENAALAFRNAIKYHARDSGLRYEYALCLMKLNRQGEAFDELKTAVRISPEFWQGHLELAKLMVKSKRLWMNSVSHAEKVCELKPDHFEAYALWILALLTGDREDQAKQVLKQGIASCKLGDLDSVLQVADLSGRVNELVQAESYFQEALILDPDSIPARIGLANILTRQSQWSKAKAFIDEVLEIDSVNWQAILSGAEWFMAQKQWEKALAEFESLSILYPTAPYPRIKMAWILSTIMGQKDRGLTIVEEVLAHNPDNQEASILGAQIHFEQQRYRSAIVNAERIKIDERNDQFLHAQSILAQSYGKLKEYAKSITFCKKVLALDPKNFTIKLNLAYGYQQQGDLSMALDVYEEASALNPGSYLPEMYSGNIYNQKGKLKAALQMYERAHEKNSQDPMVTNNLATLLIKRGEPADIDRAFHLMKDWAAKEGAHPLMLDTFGWILFHKGELGQAREYLKKATSEASDHPLFFYHLGKTCFQLNEPEQAQEALKRALSINAHFKEAHEAKRLLAILENQ